MMIADSQSTRPIKPKPKHTKPSKVSPHPKAPVDDSNAEEAIELDPASWESIEEQFNECCTLGLQNVSPTATREKLYRHLEEEGILEDVIKVTFPPKEQLKSKPVALNFIDAGKARLAMKKLNFTSVFEHRPLNMYYLVNVPKECIRSLTISGVTQENCRQTWEAIESFGPCRLYTNYVYRSTKLKEQATLSFVREGDLNEDDIQEIVEKLNRYKVNVVKVHGKEKPGEVNLKPELQFWIYLSKVCPTPGDKQGAPEKGVSKREAIIRDYVHKALGPQSLPDFQPISIEVRKENEPATVRETEGWIVSYSIERTLKLFKLLRSACYGKEVDIELLPIIRKNHLCCLFTNCVVKKKKYEKFLDHDFELAFEHQLLQINPNILQVKMRPAKNRKTYSAKIIFKSADDGGEFSASFNTKEHLDRLENTFYSCARHNIRFDVFMNSIDRKKYREFSMSSEQSQSSLSRGSHLQSPYSPSRFARGPNRVEYVEPEDGRTSRSLKNVEKPEQSLKIKPDYTPKCVPSNMMPLGGQGAKLDYIPMTFDSSEEIEPLGPPSDVMQSSFQQLWQMKGKISKYPIRQVQQVCEEALVVIIKKAYPNDDEERQEAIKDSCLHIGSYDDVYRFSFKPELLVEWASEFI